jgi:hypothetical protein
MKRRSFLQLESLEDRVTPSSKGAPILPPVTRNQGPTTSVIVHPPTGGTGVFSPMLGVTLGGGGGSGGSGDGGGGLGGSTGDPVGPGPGS